MTIYYVDVTTGNDGNDGLTEGNAWQTLAKACDTATGNNDIVYVKASADYVVQDGANDCVMYIDVAGGVNTSKRYEGYTSTVGDGGMVTINAGTNSLASPIKTALGSVFYSIVNFRLTGGSSHGFDGNSASSDGVKFTNCRFDNNSGYGCQGDNLFTFYRCQFDNNTLGAIDCDTDCHLMRSKIFNNTNSGVTFTIGAHCRYNIFYDNGGTSYAFTAGNGGICVVENNTFDGGNVADTVGVEQVNNSPYISIVLNNIFFDLDTGILDSGSELEAMPSEVDYNFFYSCNTNYSGGFSAGTNDIIGTEDPFTDSSTNDYTLKDSSEALRVGTDGGDAS